jgi:hypothetical protein
LPNFAIKFEDLARELKIRGKSCVENSKNLLFRFPLLFICITFVIAKVMALYLLLPTILKTNVYLDKGKFSWERQFYSGNDIADTLGIIWDAAHYLRIAKYWYIADDLWPFAPLFPMFIWLINEIISLMINLYPFGWFLTGLGFKDNGSGYWAISAVIVSNLFFFIALIVFFQITKIYFIRPHNNELNRQNGIIKAFFATLAFGFFPTNFAYGTIAYSESVFITFCLLAWLFFLKSQEKSKKLICFRNWEIFVSSFCAGLASLARYPGGLLFLIIGGIIGVQFIWFILKKDWSRTRIAFFDGLRFSPGFLIPLGWFLHIQSQGIDLEAVQYVSWGQRIEFPLGGMDFFLTEPEIPNVITFYELWAFVLLITLLGLSAGRLSWMYIIYTLTFIGLYTAVTGVGAYAVVRYVGTIWPAYLAFPNPRERETKIFFIIFFLYWYSRALYWMSRWMTGSFWG